MNFAGNPEANGGGIRLIAVAYFVGTIISIWILSAIGVPIPTVPGDASRDQVVVLGLLAAFALALALFPLARGLGGSAPHRFVTIFAFTYVAFAVINQLQALVFTTLGGTGNLLIFYAVPCLLASGAAVWLVRPGQGAVTLSTVVRDRPRMTWWWRPILAVLALPAIEAFAGLVTQPVLRAVIRHDPATLSVPSGGVVIATMFLKSALLVAVTVPIAISWRRSRLHLFVALGAAVFILSGVIGLLQATWWMIPMRVVFSLQILVTSAAYAAVTVMLLVPKGPGEYAELAECNR